MAVAARVAQYVMRAKQMAQDAVAADAQGDFAEAIAGYKSSLGQIEAVLDKEDAGGMSRPELDKFASAYRSRLDVLLKQQEQQKGGGSSGSSP